MPLTPLRLAKNWLRCFFVALPRFIALLVKSVYRAMQFSYLDEVQSQEIARFLVGLAIISAATFVAYLWHRLDLDTLSAVMLFLAIPVLLFFAISIRKKRP